MRLFRNWCLLIITACVLVYSCAEKSNDQSDDRNAYGIDDRETLLRDISGLEKTALLTTGELDTAVANDLMVKYQEYYTHFSADSMSSVMLFRAADIARGLGKYRKSIELLTNLHDGYVNYPKRDEVAFLIAFTWDANIHDTTRAIRGYNQVIEMYPKSPWSEEAKNNIQLLQMTEAELLKFLKEKNNKSIN